MGGAFVGMMDSMDRRQTAHLSLTTDSLIRKFNMLYTIAIILIILWLLGMVTSFAAGGLIHILLVVAVIVILVRVISGRKVL